MIPGTIQPRMNYQTVMIPTLEKESHDRKAARISLRAAALTVMLRAKTRALSRPPENQRKREARKGKGKAHLSADAEDEAEAASVAEGGTWP
jgi:hypothetical protein